MSWKFPCKGPSGWKNWLSGSDGIVNHWQEIWDQVSGECSTFGAGTVFFGNFGESNNNNGNGSNTGGNNNAVFTQLLSTCTQIRDYYYSFGEMPEGYSAFEIKFCALSIELGLNGAQNQCLFNLNPQCRTPSVIIGNKRQKQNILYKR
jgi:hypothetical protein